MRKLRVRGEGEMIDWIHFLCGTIEIFCLGYIYFHYLKLHNESRTERMRLRNAMDYALCIDNILTSATMSEDKRKKLQTCFHDYLAAIGFCSMNMSIDWDVVAMRRAEMDEVLALSGWEWRADDRDGEDPPKRCPYPPMQEMLRRSVPHSHQGVRPGPPRLDELPLPCPVHLLWKTHPQVSVADRSHRQVEREAEEEMDMTEREDHILASAVIVLGATIVSILAVICTPGSIIAGASAWLAGIAWAWTEVSCSR